ncbi:hypothetical protein BKA70DRAFT_206344 [Coprinopsis sp. MPI-PUGE-AT-0042]|nr:hypothetical protein BKA70DRAFT_206344 [Coprinopsis sp. MPI-PUGE-AT-0042]
MFNTSVQDPFIKGNLDHAWKNSWGLSTRAIGGIVMVLAITRAWCSLRVCRGRISKMCVRSLRRLRKAGVRAKTDLRDAYTPGYLQVQGLRMEGRPLGLEIGPNQLAKKQTLTVRRDTGAQNPDPLDDIASAISSTLNTIQADMFATAKTTYWEHVKTIMEKDDAVNALDAKHIVVIPRCESETCEGVIRAVVDNRCLEVLNHAMNDKMDDVCSGCGEQEPVRPFNPENDKQPIFLSVHTGKHSPIVATDRLDSWHFILRGLLISLAGSHNERPRRAGGRGRDLGQREGSD